MSIQIKVQILASYMDVCTAPKGSSTHQYNVPSFWAEFLAVWSKYYTWLREFPDKNSNFGLLYGRVYGPLRQKMIITYKLLKGTFFLWFKCALKTPIIIRREKILHIFSFYLSNCRSKRVQKIQSISQPVLALQRSHFVSGFLKWEKCHILHRYSDTWICA